MSKAVADIFLWRRHTPTCPQVRKGRKATKCNCPVWCDSFVDGKRRRESMGTRDWTRAEWKLSGSLTPKLADQAEDKALEEAVTGYLADCRARGLEPSTVVSYENTLDRLLCIVIRTIVLGLRCFGRPGDRISVPAGRVKLRRVMLRIAPQS